MNSTWYSGFAISSDTHCTTLQTNELDSHHLFTCLLPGQRARHTSMVGRPSCEHGFFWKGCIVASTCAVCLLCYNVAGPETVLLKNQNNVYRINNASIEGKMCFSVYKWINFRNVIPIIYKFKKVTWLPSTLFGWVGICVYQILPSFSSLWAAVTLCTIQCKLHWYNSVKK